MPSCLHMRGALLLALALPLAGCQQDAQAPAAVTNAAAASPFDGRYRATLQRTRDTGQCGGATVTRTMTVSSGQVRMLYNPNAGFSATGRVAEDGSFALGGGSGFDLVRIQGRIEGSGGTGTFESGSCSYDMTLARAS